MKYESKKYVYPFELFEIEKISSSWIRTPNIFIEGQGFSFPRRIITKRSKCNPKAFKDLVLLPDKPFTGLKIITTIEDSLIYFWLI